MSDHKQNEPINDINGMSYPEELKALLIAFLKYGIEKSQSEKLTVVAPAKPLDPADRLDITDAGGLTDKGVRQLHEALCRQVGYSHEQIIAEWNERCPEDPW